MKTTCVHCHGRILVMAHRGDPHCSQECKRADVPLTEHDLHMECGSHHRDGTPCPEES